MIGLSAGTLPVESDAARSHGTGQADPKVPDHQLVVDIPLRKVLRPRDVKRLRAPTPKAVDEGVICGVEMSRYSATARRAETAGFPCAGAEIAAETASEGVWRVVSGLTDLS